MNHMQIIFSSIFSIFLISLVTADSPLNLEPIRVLRQAPGPAEVPQNPESPAEGTPVVVKGKFKDFQKKYNLADPVSADYPVIFNILLFIGVSLVLAVIAIAVAISTMDPGRDSLIYRVTSGQKAKKDN